MLNKPPSSRSLRNSGWIQTRRSWSLCCQSQGHSSTKLMTAGHFLWWKSLSARLRCWCFCSPSMAATWSRWSPSCLCSPQPGFSSCPQGKDQAWVPSPRDEWDGVHCVGLPAHGWMLNPARKGLTPSTKRNACETQGPLKGMISFFSGGITRKQASAFPQLTTQDTWSGVIWGLIAYPGQI